MKLFNIFILTFTIFAFLTVGSLMMIVSLHVLTMEDALLKVQDLYDDPWKCFQTGVTGVLFIFAGLMFTKTLVKAIRRDDDVMLYGKWGYMSVSLKAIDELVKRVLRKFEVVKELRTETEVEGAKLKVVANLTVVSGWNLPQLVNTIQSDLSERLNKLLGGGIELELQVNVVKILD